jgi:hypothetical protein
MVYAKIILYALLVGMLTGCSWGRLPKDAVSLDSADSMAHGIPGLTLLAEGDDLQPFVRQGRLLYDRKRAVIENQHVIRTDRTVYDDRGGILADWSPEIPLERIGIEYNDLSTQLIFSGELDPAGRMVYLVRRYPRESIGLVLYDLSMRDTAKAVEFFSLPALRRQAEEMLESFDPDSDLRERLKQAGCLLPEFEYPKVAAYEGLNRVEKIRKSTELLEGKVYEQEMYRTGQLIPYLDSLQAEYEKVIGRFIADNHSGAFHYQEYVVLPQKGFAIEPTFGISLPDLPTVGVEPLPEWDKRRKDVTLRRIGRKRRLQFTPVAFIPWWTMRRTDYYRLTVDGSRWTVCSEDCLRVFDTRESDRKFCFSLIDRSGQARLFVYEKR